MSALSYVLTCLVFGWSVGIALGFISEWSKRTLLAIMGLLVLSLAVISGSIVLTGDMSMTPSYSMTEIIGFVAYAIGLIAGDPIGQFYYRELLGDGS